MSKSIHPIALFRLSVLGPLASRDKLERGELKVIINDLAKKSYAIPGSKRFQLQSQTIEKWYYAWKRGGIDALAPKIRSDKDTSQISVHVQEQLIALKKEQPSRSINTLITIVEKLGLGKLTRASVHRLLKTNNLSRRTIADAVTIERRAFTAEHIGDIWYGDVMHGPRIGKHKVYMVTCMDDTSRLIAHSAFCFGETALDIEGVLKQALLKRGLPKKLIIDNGAAYRSETLQKICADLKIRLIYCRPYEPEGKGKLERYHRTFRELFLNEIDLQSIHNLEELNARLWVWIEQIYHKRPHLGLNNKTPLEIWQNDLAHIQPLGTLAQNIDSIFYHRDLRYVRKDGTISWNGKIYEVPYEYTGCKVVIVVDPHINAAIHIEDEDGKNLGKVVLLDPKANLNRKRQRPDLAESKATGVKMVDMAYTQFNNSIKINSED